MIVGILFFLICVFCIYKTVQTNGVESYDSLIWLAVWVVFALVAIICFIVSYATG